MLRRGTRLAALIILTAAAAEAKVDVELQPYGGPRTATALGEGYYENDLADRLDVAPGVSFGLTCDFPVGGIGPTGQQAMIELSFSYQRSDLRFEPASMDKVPDVYLDRFEVKDDKLILGDIEVMYLHGGGLYRFGNYSGWLPFANFGVGATFFAAPDGGADSRTKFSFSFGAGAARMFSERLGARLGFRGYMTSLPAEEAYWRDPWGGVWSITDDNWLFQGELSLGLVVRF